MLGLIQADELAKAAGLAVFAADTGRVLMLQRVFEEGDPAAGMWEFPGGGREDGEDPLDTAKREWSEETGCDLPDGKVLGKWHSGVYCGYVWRVGKESDVPLFEGRDEVNNPDDPDGDTIEALAWWDLGQLTGSNPALRDELRLSIPKVLSAFVDVAGAMRSHSGRLTRYPGQPRDNDGQWASTGGVGRDVLGIARRIVLDDGETFVASESGKIQRGADEYGIPMALVNTPDGPRLRLGEELNGDATSWDADPYSVVAELSPDEIRQMFDNLTGMTQRWDQEEAQARELGERVAAARIVERGTLRKRPATADEFVETGRATSYDLVYDPPLSKDEQLLFDEHGRYIDGYPSTGQLTNGVGWALRGTDGDDPGQEELFASVFFGPEPQPSDPQFGSRRDVRSFQQRLDSMLGPIEGTTPAQLTGDAARGHQPSRAAETLAVAIVDTLIGGAYTPQQRQARDDWLNQSGESSDWERAGARRPRAPRVGAGVPFRLNDNGQWVDRYGQFADLPDAPKPVKKAATKATPKTPEQKKAAKAAKELAELRKSIDAAREKSTGSDRPREPGPANESAQGEAVEPTRPDQTSPAVPRRTTLKEAKRQALLDAVHGHADLAGEEHGDLYQAIRENVDSGKWGPVQGRFSARQAETTLLKEASSAVGRGDDEAAERLSGIASRYAKLAEDIHASTSVAKTDKYLKPRSADEPLRADGDGTLGEIPAGRVPGDVGPGDVLREPRGTDREPGRRPGRRPGADGADGSAVRDPDDADDRGETGSGEGGTGGDAAAGRGGRDGRVDAPVFRPRSQDDLAPATEKKRLAANIEALRMLRTIQADDRPATAEEQAKLARWSGWGSLPAVFKEPPPDMTYAAAQTKLKELLSPAEFAAARRTTRNAHYTDAGYVRAIWDAMRALGFEGGQVLEPGSGSGTFMGLVPEGISGDTHVTGVELDPITAAIAQALYPNHGVRSESFADTKAADGSFDAAIGNVPFSDTRLVDPEYNPGRKHNMHNHFIIKSLRLTRPGGLVSVITSRYTMDSLNPAARQEMAELGDLVGAVRLPSGAHKRAAGTDVVTDLLVFRRRKAGEPYAGTPFANTRTVEVDGKDVAINEFFVGSDGKPTAMVLGTLGSVHGMRGKDDLTVKGDKDAEPSLREALAGIIEQAKQKGLTQTPGRSEPPRFATTGPTRRPDGFLQSGPDGGFTRLVRGIQQPHNVPATQAAELRHLLQLRDTAMSLIDVEASTADDTGEMKRLRENLNETYDSYVAKYGPVSRYTETRRAAKDGDDQASDVEEGSVTRRRPPQGGFRADPFSAVVRSLEIYDPVSGQARKADLLHRRAISPRTPRTAADTPADALALSLDQHGEVDIDYIGDLLGSEDEPETREALGTLVFDEPGTGRIVPAAEYLSGNVREKLHTARLAAADDPRFSANVEGLERVLPPDLTPTEIRAKMGSGWIDPRYVQQFLREILRDRTLMVERRHGTDWKVTSQRKASTAATTEWGTREQSAVDLAEDILAQRPVRVMVDGKLNRQKTEAAKAKAQDIADRFETWAWEDPTRQKELQDTYNQLLNSLVLRSYPGDEMSLPGLSRDGFYPFPHRFAAIRRIINEPSVGLWHEVGAGKSSVMIIGAMEMRRLGMVRKPAVVVPNHMLDQMTQEFLERYPQAKILAIGSDDLKNDKNGEKRREIIARAATGDWDAVILTQGAFKRLPVSTETEKAYLQAEVEPLRRSVARRRAEVERQVRARNEGASDDEISILVKKALDGDPTVKELEGLVEKAEERVKEHVGKVTRDPGLTFEQTGIDYLFIDECFPYETMVLTDRGELPIGEIVENGLRVNVASTNLRTGRVEWKPVHRWVRKRASALVRIIHESGSFDCTPNHPIWVDGRGFVRADRLQPGSILRTLPKGIQSTDVASTVLLTGMQVSGLGRPTEGTGQAMRAMRDGLHTHKRQPSTVLLEPMCSYVAHGSTGCEGLPDRGSRLEFGKDEGGSPTAARCADACHESDGGPSQPGEGVCFPEGADVAVGPWREGPSHGASTDSRGPARPADGVLYSDRASGAYVRVAAELVLRGHRGPGHEDRSGGGWELTPDTQVEIPGSAQDAGLGSSRVVRVEILEQGGNGGPATGRVGDSVVYNLEIADNHNYFANGVIVSNCHTYKNLRTSSRIQGMGIPGSDIATDLHMKLHHLRSKHHRVATLATATPIANSVGEAYTMMRYLRPDLLEAMGVDTFDDFAANFGEIVTRMEVAPTGGLRQHSRFARFVNIPEFLKPWLVASDVKTADDLKGIVKVPDLAERVDADGRRTRTPETVVVPPSEELKDLMAALVVRANSIPYPPRKGGDNMLRITGEGRAAALDLQMVGRETDEPTKLDVAADRISGIYADNKDRVYADRDGNPVGATGALQLVFSDIGTPTKKKTKKKTAGDGEEASTEEIAGAGLADFTAYEALRDKLVERGIPRSKVRFIHDAKTDQEKAELFAAARDGRIAVLVGSTGKMGVGTNVQDRAIALHHLDAPWRPADVQQREGRIIRQGNKNPEVQVIRYVTEQSFDAYIWQAITTKAEFINQIMRGRADVREMEDVGDFALSAQEVTALGTGNRWLIEHADAKADLTRLERALRNHEADQRNIDRQITASEADITASQRFIEEVDQAITKRVDTRGDNFHMRLGDTDYDDRPDAQSRLREHLKAIARGEERGSTLGQFGGFPLRATGTDNGVEVELAGVPGAVVNLGRAEVGSGDVIGKLQHALGNLEKVRARHVARTDEARHDIESLRSRLGKPFRDAEALDAARDRFDRVERQLKEELARRGETIEPQDPEAKAVAQQAAEMTELRERLGRGEGFQGIGEVTAWLEADPQLADKIPSDAGAKWAVLSPGGQLLVDKGFKGYDVTIPRTMRTPKPMAGFRTQRDAKRFAELVEEESGIPWNTGADITEWRDPDGATAGEVIARMRSERKEWDQNGHWRVAAVMAELKRRTPERLHEPLLDGQYRRDDLGIGNFAQMTRERREEILAILQGSDSASDLATATRLREYGLAERGDYQAQRFALAAAQRLDRDFRKRVPQPLDKVRKSFEKDFDRIEYNVTDRARIDQILAEADASGDLIAAAAKLRVMAEEQGKDRFAYGRQIVMDVATGLADALEQLAGQADDFDGWNESELRALLAQHGLPTDGDIATLKARLRAAGVSVAAPATAAELALAGARSYKATVDVGGARMLLAAFDRSTDPEPSLEDIARFARAAGTDTHPGGERLKHWWVYGEGLAKWIDKPHRWTALYNQLKKHMPPEMAKRVAAEWFHERLGYWPGHQKGENPTGPG